MQKKAIHLSIILIGISAGILTGLNLRSLNETLSLSDIPIFLFSILINIVLLTLFGLPVLVYLRNVTRALTHLSEGKPADPVQMLPLGLFAELTEAVNRIIDGQQEFQMARGRLYEQISEVAAQEERKRLARDLHDSIKQQLFSISISAAAAHACLENNPTAAREALIDVKQSAQEAMVEMRALLQQLSPTPLEKSGLIEALREQCEAFSYRTGAHVQTRFGNLPPDDRLPAGTQAVIFRIAQEALSNIARHARARHVDLKLYVQDDQQVVLDICDDGQGFDTTVTSSGMGLNNMRSRAESIHADFNLNSSPANGTQLTVTIPLITPPPEETMIFEQCETQRKAVISQYWWFAGTVSATIAAASLLLWRAVSRSDNFFSDVVTQVILIILVVVTVLGVPMICITGRRAYRSTQALLAAVHQNRQTQNWLMRHWYMMQLVIAIVAMCFVPLMAINPVLSSFVPIIIGMVFLGVAARYYTQMYKLYREEIWLMPPSARIEEMDKRLGELRTSWVTILMLLVVQIFTMSISDAFRLPPVEADHWITLSLVGITGLLLCNQIISILVYRGWRDKAVQERAFA